MQPRWGVPTTEKGFLPALHRKDPEPLHADAETGRPHTENPSVSQSFTDTFLNTERKKVDQLRRKSADRTQTKSGILWQPCVLNQLQRHGTVSRQPALITLTGGRIQQPRVAGVWGPPTGTLHRAHEGERACQVCPCGLENAGDARISQNKQRNSKNSDGFWGLCRRLGGGRGAGQASGLADGKGRARRTVAPPHTLGPQPPGTAARSRIV